MVDAAPHGLVYRETFFTPARHLAAGQDLADIVADLDEGLAAAEAKSDIENGHRQLFDLGRGKGGAFQPNCSRKASCAGGVVRGVAAGRGRQPLGRLPS